MKKDNIRGRVEWFLMIIFFMFLGQIALAGVSLGGVIDKSNWQNAQGLVPDQLLDLIKKGDFVLNVVDNVNMDTANRETGFFQPYIRKSFKANIGRYDLDKKNLIVDVKTGKYEPIIGVPFPDIDPNDPKAGAKIMYNQDYITSGPSERIRSDSTFKWIGRSGLERKVESYFIDNYLIGSPSAAKIPNPEGFEERQIMTMTAPYDIAGTSMMTWRYIGEERDANFAYLPVIRRVRRTSPASRSDALLGSDMTMDDIKGYNGKIMDFEMKLLGKRQGLLPFQQAEPARVKRNEKGEMEVVKEGFQLPIYGYEKKDFAGAPWCPLSTVYARRPAYVVELKPKDPYYNYGTQYLWFDAETCMASYKVVYDRGGRFWKLILIMLQGFETADKTWQTVGLGDHVVIDVLRDHATSLLTTNPKGKNGLVMDAVLDFNDFSLGGFQKYCK